jgi:hypothetical protein
VECEIGVAPASCRRFSDLEILQNRGGTPAPPDIARQALCGVRLTNLNAWQGIFELIPFLAPCAVWFVYWP